MPNRQRNVEVLHAAAYSSKHPLWIGDIQTYEERKFCWSCSLDNLYELETGDYEFKNKKAVITNIRQQLMVADTKEVYE